MTAAEREQIANTRAKRLLYRRWRQAKACGKCGTPTQRFARCLPCRRKQARWALAWYHRQKSKAA